MFKVYVIYDTLHPDPRWRHWELVFEYLPEEPDNSITTPDEIYFQINPNPQTNQIIPIKTYHIVQALGGGDFPFRYSHAALRGAGTPSDTTQKTSNLATFENSKLAEILELCERVPLPERSEGKNCQDWVKWVMEQVMGGFRSKVDPEYQGELARLQEGE